MTLWPSSLTKGTFRESSHAASQRTVSVNLHPYVPFCSSYYDFLLMQRGGLCDCLAIMGLCLINHVDPLCFTSEAAALRLINGDQGPLKREIGYRLSSSEYTSPQRHNLWWPSRRVEHTTPRRIMMSPGVLWPSPPRRAVRMTCCFTIYNLWTSNQLALRWFRGQHWLWCTCWFYDLLLSGNRFLVSPGGAVDCQRLGEMGGYPVSP